jgi:hypothetical protein
VGSICPKIVDGDPTDPGYGYNPAVQAIVDRLAEKLAGKCLPRELTLDEEGTVPCEVVEAKPAGIDDSPLNCGAAGRSEVEDQVRDSVLKQLEAAGRCGGSSNISCSEYEMCSINQTNSNECFFTDGDPNSFADSGFCYIDPAKGPNSGGISPADGVACNEDDTTWQNCTNPIVKNCPATERRLLRFVGKDTPAKDSITFVACTADGASSDAPIPSAPEAVVSTGGTGN